MPIVRDQRVARIDRSRLTDELTRAKNTGGGRVEEVTDRGKLD